MKPTPYGYLQAHKIAAHVTSGGQEFNYPEVQEKAPEENSQQQSTLF